MLAKGSETSKAFRAGTNRSGFQQDLRPQSQRNLEKFAIAENKFNSVSWCPTLPLQLVGYSVMNALSLTNLGDIRKSQISGKNPVPRAGCHIADFTGYQGLILLFDCSTLYKIGHWYQPSETGLE